jgi:pimeloyl-ACP methyl ester carboxylesterase
VSLVGWSLGGIFARTLVRRSPELVRQVVTLGSPFRLARSDQSRATRVFERFSHLHVEHLSLPLEDGAEPLPVPTTSVYSRYDGIVAWRACLDAPGPFAENVEVYGSHLGLGHNPAVIWAVTDRLAQPEGAWRPFRAPAALRPFFPRPGTPTADARPDPGTPDPLTGSAA